MKTTVKIGDSEVVPISLDIERSNQLETYRAADKYKMEFSPDKHGGIVIAVPQGPRKTKTRKVGEVTKVEITSLSDVPEQIYNRTVPVTVLHNDEQVLQGKRMYPKEFSFKDNAWQATLTS